MLYRYTNRDGFMDYADLVTQTTPIVYTTGSPLKLTNDGAGAQTLKTYKPAGVTELRNTTTNQLNFSGLSLGDEVSIRISLDLTTISVNQESFIYVNMAIGGNAYSVYDGNWYFKVATVRPVGAVIKLYMGNTDTITRPAELMFVSDANASIKMNGFYISVKKR